MDLSIGQQWSLFDPPKTVDAKAAGLHAGMNGEPADNNPHQPGSEEHVEWRAGWGDGQKTITDRMGPSH
jgi:ribosome modulation factor